MPLHVVADASAVVKWLVDEPNAGAYRQWQSDRMTEGALFLAPHLLRYELGHVLARVDPRRAPEDREARLAGAMLGFAFADGTSTSAQAPPLSYYDASYLSLAESMKATLVSYDKVLLAAAKKAGIATLSPS